ncbi:MAG: hypothetical protein IKY01_07055 [Prevotella sp.]|nr:hypothetical protein [Prevotella sp.]MBR5748530.1 hypothetical protein [Prevotella sp.]
MLIKRLRNANNGDGSFSFRLKYTPGSDLKKPLQKWLRMELEHGCYCLHSEEEFRDYMRENIFGYLPDWFAREVTEWAFMVAYREGYVCRSQHDQNAQVPMFYIPRSLLDLKCGPHLKVSDQYAKDFDMIPGVSADFEEQKPITKLEDKKNIEL